MTARKTDKRRTLRQSTGEKYPKAIVGAGSEDTAPASTVLEQTAMNLGDAVSEKDSAGQSAADAPSASEETQADGEEQDSRAADSRAAATPKPNKAAEAAQDLQAAKNILIEAQSIQTEKKAQAARLHAQRAPQVEAAADNPAASEDGAADTGTSPHADEDAPASASAPEPADPNTLAALLSLGDAPNGMAPEPADTLEPASQDAHPQQPSLILDEPAEAVIFAEAAGSVLMQPQTQVEVLKNCGTPRDMLAGARAAGALAGKRTGELVPTCPARAIVTCELAIRPIAVTEAEVLNGWAGPREDGRAGFLVQARCSGTSATDARTEALNAVSVACLTLFDQLKQADHTLVIADLQAPTAADDEPEAAHAQDTETERAPEPAVYVSPLPGGSSAGAAAPAVAFIGFQNAGKTTLVERVIAKLSNRGLRVGSIKLHGPKGFDIDQPGKDSWRHAQAGSRHVGLISPDQYAEYASTEQEVPVADLLTHFTDVDIVIVEGYKTTGIPSIVVARSGVDRIRGTNSYDLIDQDTLAIACNDVTARGFRAHWTKMMENTAEDEDAKPVVLPTFLDINDIPEIVSFVVDKLELGKK